MKKNKIAMLLFTAVLGIGLASCNNSKPAEPTLDSIEIKTQATKKEFTVGEKFTSAGLVLAGRYSDNSIKDIASGFTTNPAEGYTFTTADVSTAKEVVVTLSEKTCKYTVSVNAGIDPIQHRTPYVKTLGEGIQREYDERFDEMVDDFSTSQRGPVLRVLVDSEDPDFPNTPAKTIYKQGTGKVPFAQGYSIGLRVKLVEGELPLANLILALRGAGADNDANVYPINLKDALDDNGDELPALKTGEFVELVISPNQSIEDENTKYPGTEVLVLNDIVAFHFYAVSNVEMSAVLEIEEVFARKDGQEDTLLDSFSREKVNVPSEGAWWNDSVGFIRQRGTLVSGTTTYTIPSTVNWTDYGKVVLSINGDTSGATVGGKAWANLKGDAETAALSAVTGAYGYAVIDAEESGLTTTADIVISSSTPLEIAKVFLTNLEKPAPAEDYPNLNPDSFLILDDFSRNANPDPDYETSVTKYAEDPTINYFIDYAQAGRSSMDGEDLTFLPSTNSTPANTVIGFKNSGVNYKYLVLPMKVSGGDLSQFRFKLNTITSHKWPAEWFAAEGLPTIPTNPSSYEYVNDGYTLYIFDLDFMGMNGDIGEIGFYYTGDATINIASVILANADVFELEGAVHSSPVGKEFDVSGYSYVGWAGNEEADAAYITVHGDGESNLKTLRFERPGKTEWWIKNLVCYDEDGRGIDGTATLPTTDVTIVIPFAVNGISTAAGDVHFHIGEEEASGIVSIAEIGLIAKGAHIATGGAIPGDLNGPNGWLYGGFINHKMTKVEMTFTFTDDSDFSDFYFVLANDGKGEYTSAETVCANKSELADTLYSWKDGAPFVHGEKQDSGTTRTLVIDFEQLPEGITLIVGSHFHIKCGSWATLGVHATIDSSIGLVNQFMGWQLPINFPTVE